MIKTFCTPFLEAIEEDRRDCHLRPGDIDDALKAFGPGLVKIYINPMYLEGKTKINYTFPEDLQIEGHAGCGGWELMGEIKEIITTFHGQRGRGMSEHFPGTKIPVDKKTVDEVIQDAADKEQEDKGVKTTPLGSPDPSNQRK